MSTILVAEDEPHLRRALAVNLRAHGYQVIEAGDGRQALHLAAASKVDLLLLDLGLPELGGLEVIEGLRGWTALPIIVLTVRNDQRTKVRALDAGADDYVTKPFGMEELLARVRAALRRANPEPSAAPVMELSACTVDLARRTVERNGTAIHLTPTEWAIMEHLARHPHKLVTQRQLLDAVWGPTYDPDTNLLRVHMGHLRRKLEADSARPDHFLTEPGVGYRFEPSPRGSTSPGAAKR